MTTERQRYWMRMCVMNVVAAAVVATVFGGVGIRTPLRQAASVFGVAFTFSICIGPLLAIAMPRVGPRAWRLAFPLNWALAIVAMIVVALVGSAIAIGLLIVAGTARPSQFAEWFAGSLRISIVITLVFGIFVTAYEVMRARVAHADAAARLASLEARVQPHFLFNTLNSIAALIHDDPHGAERMTGQLASLLRSSLDAETPLVTVGDELQTLAAYLDIERVRFGARLRYTINADDAARTALVPRFAIQTLVENSVKFAVGPRRDGAGIGVAAEVRDGRLCVAVVDDGPGFAESAIVDGHGLALLRDRLGVLFGKSARLTVRGQPGAMRVAFDVPIRTDSAGERR
jgi:LytS/YehU family sensor histidine kinase